MTEDVSTGGAWAWGTWTCSIRVPSGSHHSHPHTPTEHLADAMDRRHRSTVRLRRWAAQQNQEKAS